MIPKTAEYALRAAVLLARTPKRPLSADEIAGAGRVPRRYANKVLQALVRCGFVRSQPGPGGGYILVTRPEELSILDVIGAVEPIPRIVRCPLGLPTHTVLCPLHRTLDDALAAMERTFGGVTIAQVVRHPDGVPPLCDLDGGAVVAGSPARAQLPSEGAAAIDGGCGEDEGCRTIARAPAGPRDPGRPCRVGANPGSCRHCD